MLSPERGTSDGDMKRGSYKGEKSFTDHAVLFFFLFIKIYVSMPTRILTLKKKDLESFYGEFLC